MWLNKNFLGHTTLTQKQTITIFHAQTKKVTGVKKKKKILGATIYGFF